MKEININNFEEKVVTLKVKNYRTPLPLDYYEINCILYLFYE